MLPMLGMINCNSVPFVSIYGKTPPQYLEACVESCFLYMNNELEVETGFLECELQVTSNKAPF